MWGKLSHAPQQPCGYRARGETPFSEVAATKPRLSHLPPMAEKPTSNICPRFHRFAVGSFIALCLNQGVGLPRLCGTPCREIAVSHSLRLRGNPLRHAADVLANNVSTNPWLTCICFWVFMFRTAPSCTWRQAVLRSLSPPSLRLISVSIPGFHVRPIVCFTPQSYCLRLECQGHGVSRLPKKVLDASLRCS